MASALPDMISALFKRLSANPASPLFCSFFQILCSSSSESDFESLTARFSNLSLKGEEHSNNDELLRWVKFAESFLKNSDAPLKALTDLNEELIPKSVLLGNGLKPSPADVIVYVAVHSYVNGLSKSDRAKFPHLLRWADYIQNREDIQPFKKIVIDKPAFVLPAAANTPQVSKPLKKVEDPNPKKAVEEPKEAGKSDTVSKGKKSADTQKKKVEESQASQEKKKLPEKDTEKKDEELSVSLLKIQIGQIRKAWKHPSADSLLVEEIDVGEAKCRQVVSGLAKYCTPEELTNRQVVLITNVKPGKLRDVMSEGLVLCASSKDHTVVEPLIAPDGAKVGECVTFSGIDGKPEEVLNPKKKQLDKITPNLFTDEKGVATFKGIPFTTSSGPCTSSIPNASIK